MPTPPHDPLRELGPLNRDAIYAELRERTPVYWSSVYAGWILTRYADVSAILRHPDALVLDAMPLLEALCRRGNLDLSSLITFYSSLSLLTRPPRHAAIRRVLAQTLGEIWRLNLPEVLARRADLLLELGERDGAIDLAGGYGKALALFVIGSLLGVPEGDQRELSTLALDLPAVFERNLSVNALRKLDKCAAALMDYFAGLIKLRRKNPGDDGTSRLVRLADEQLECSDEDLSGYCTFFFVAAEETTAASISGSAHLLLQRPALRAQLTSDPSRVPHAVREFLRLTTAVQYAARELPVDIRLAGQLIPAGEPIIVMLGAANRDPAAFPDPDELNLDRSGPESLVLAAGPESSIGAQLAAMELDIAVRKLLERPRLQLSPQPPVWTDRTNVAPLKHLQAHFVSTQLL
jgi:cytochrome P450